VTARTEKSIQEITGFYVRITRCAGSTHILRLHGLAPGLLGIEKPGFTTGLSTGDVDPEALPQASFAFIPKIAHETCTLLIFVHTVHAVSISLAFS
jgi:hypothetical protein